MSHEFEFVPLGDAGPALQRGVRGAPRRRRRARHSAPRRRRCGSSRTSRPTTGPTPASKPTRRGSCAERRLRLVDGARWPRYLDRVPPHDVVRGSGRRVGRATHQLRSRRRHARSRRRACGCRSDRAGSPCACARASLTSTVSRRASDGSRARRDAPGSPRRRSAGRGRCATPTSTSLGHVNNAAVWQAVSEVVPRPSALVSVTHHQSLERDDDVVLATCPVRCGSSWTAPSRSRRPT